jgi:hypothetical protein
MTKKKGKLCLANGHWFGFAGSSSPDVHLRGGVVQLSQDELGIGGLGHGFVDNRHFDCKKNR